MHINLAYHIIWSVTALFITNSKSSFFSVTFWLQTLTNLDLTKTEVALEFAFYRDKKCNLNSCFKKTDSLSFYHLSEE